MFIRIGQAAIYLGFSKTTLRNWDISGLLVPSRSPGNHRLYTRDLLEDFIQVLAKFGKKIRTGLKLINTWKNRP